MRLVLSCLICVPSILMAQSPAVERFQQDLKNSQRGMFVLLEDQKAPLYPEFRKLMQEETLAELKLDIRVVQEGQRQSALVEYLQGRYSWKKGRHWAFIDTEGRCLAQGTNLPNLQALTDQLALAGIESPVRRLRAFMRQYPEHLDGKVALLRTLRSIAIERTRGVLDSGSNPQLRPSGGNMRNPNFFGNREEQVSRLLGVGADEKPVQLSAGDDVKIWYRWADEFDKLMSSGQWLESNFAFEIGDEFLDRHSPYVQSVYKKRIALVEDALRRWPGNNRIWGIWVHMSLVLGDKPAKRLVDDLAPMPDTIPGTWPPEDVKLILIKEARRSGNWRDLRDLLWDSWLQFSQTLSGIGTLSNAMGFGNQMRENRLFSRAIELQWRQMLEPLIESLLMIGDIAAADSVVNQLKDSAQWDEVSEYAAEVAIRCQMPQVAARWKN